MNIKQTKFDKCVICFRRVYKPNILLKYHIRYNPPLIIIACKYCNYAEKALRTGYLERCGFQTRTRFYRVSLFHKRFKISLKYANPSREFIS